MVDLHRLVVELSALDPTQDNSEAARDIAAQLLEGALKERWRLAPASRRDNLARDSANRVWAGYSSRFEKKDLCAADAAYEAIQEELAVLRNYG